MSTTVTYKGNVIATVDNNTKTLKTQGKYMEGDVILADVSGGASTAIVGEFTAPSAGSTKTIAVPYTGNGYPISLHIYLADGYSAYTNLPAKAIFQANIIKSYMADAPIYGSALADEDIAYVAIQYRNTTSAISPNNGGGEASVYTSTNPSGLTTAHTKINSSTQFKVYSTNSPSSNGQGYAPNAKYIYVINYSE